MGTGRAAEAEARRRWEHEAPSGAERRLCVPMKRAEAGPWIGNGLLFIYEKLFQL